MDTRNLRSIVNTPIKQSWGMALVILLGTGGSQVQAQSIDYGSLEALFGEPVTISVTGSPQRKSEVPATMDIITAEDIRRSGARDIPGVLRHVAGIDVLQWANDSADVAIRGYNQAFSPRLLVLIDGRQVYADFFGFTPWAALPVELEGIRQIEVVKGPNSALFGFNAVGGVINIITYHPLHDDVDTVSVTGGTQDLAQGSLVATTRLGDAVGLRLVMGGNSNDDFSTPQSALDVGSRRGNLRKAFNLESVFQISQDTDLSIELTHTETEQADEIVTYQMVFEKYEISSVQGVLSADTSFGLLQAKLYANSLKLESDLRNGGGLFNFDNDVVVAQLQDIFQIGNRHTLRAAIEYRSNEVGTTPISGAHISSEIMAASAMWAWKIAPDLSLTNAVRIDRMSLGRNGYVPPGFGLSNGDWNNRSFTEPSFNSGLVWTAGESGVFRMTVGRGVQTPSLAIFGASLVALVPGLPIYSNGNPFVDPAIVMNYELGWERPVSALDAKFRINAFYETTEELATLFGGPPVSAAIVSSSANLGNSESHGLEISLEGMHESWRWGLSYTPQIVNDHRRPGFPVETTLVEFEHTHPEHVVNGNLGWSRGVWEVDGYFRYQSAFHLLQSTGLVAGTLVPISDYFSVDGRLAYRFSTNVTLALSGQNLLHREQQQTSTAAVERRVLVTVSMDF